MASIVPERPGIAGSGRAAGPPLPDPGRLALVIGNDQYQHVGALKNARNDARLTLPGRPDRMTRRHA